jgi:haloacetate dehalogenase
MLFEHFEMADVPTPRGRVRARIGGSGPPLLLLHGFPETHLMWHAVAPTLLERFTVVVADLPGYGDSFRPPVTADHVAHSKRALATDLLAAMSELGHAEFAVVGHDRGGRVAYRMALDHPAAVSQLAVLDIVPTGEIWSRADASFAIGYWHWSFLAQPAPLPEQMILGKPEAFWISAQRLGLKEGERYPQDVLNAYRAQCADPRTVEAMCEDYRAGATIDRRLDDADRGEVRPHVAGVRDGVSWHGLRWLARLYFAAAILSSDPLLNHTTAIVTDGRYSGAMRGPCIGHVAPEALDGGPIALVEENDLIELNVPERRLAVVGVDGRPRAEDDVTEILAGRRARWSPRPRRHTRGILSLYEQISSDASHGAALLGNGASASAHSPTTRV